MLTLKNLTMKNFMSVGNTTQAVKFDEKDFVLVLGENLDLGGNDARNGVGKSTLLNALSYAIYGNAMTKIKKPNLINKTNSKAMLVTLDFTINGIDYRIERGRKPEVLKFSINGNPLKDPDSDEAQGEMRFTQEEIERKIGFSSNMFQNIVALTTNGLPFLSSPAAAQREVIEHLLGITKMSEKAEKLKDLIKVTKDNVKKEEFKISAVQEANKRIETTISTLKRKERLHEQNTSTEKKKVSASIAVLCEMELSDEIDAHKNNATVSSLQEKSKSINKEIASIERELKTLTKALTLTQKNISIMSQKNCPTCGQDVNDETHRRLHDEHEKEIDDTEKKINKKQREKEKLSKELHGLGDIPDPISTFYSNIEDAYDHKSTLDTLRKDEARLAKDVNPFTSEIKNLEKNGLQEVDYNIINALTEEQEHQEFLLKLLTNKDSFIRKKIVNQNLSYLNARLAHYLTKIGLPHEVEFQSDLSVDITEHGRDLDFDNLSRGEKTRLMLSLSWAFRDVYEQLNDGINLLFIDELLDNGLDTSGVEAAVSVLKTMNRESNRNIFLISHRDELIGRIDDVLYVRKEGGFTSFHSDDD